MSDKEYGLGMVRERWVVAVEGELGSDNRGLVAGSTIWVDRAPVLRNGPNYSSEQIGELSDFKRDPESREITALYEGEPLQGTLSLDGVLIDSVGGMRSRWMVYEIRRAVDLDGPTMFDNWVRKID